VLSLSFALFWLIQSPIYVEAPPQMLAEKARIELHAEQLRSVALFLGLSRIEPPVRIELAAASSAWSASMPEWIAGFARQDRVVIFPSRSPRYPDNTLDDVVRHEVAHALIWRASLGHDLPRWFNEGLATTSERERTFRDQTQFFLHLITGSRLSLSQIDRLFQGGEAERTRAYLLSGALVGDLLQSHGKGTAARILDRVAGGASFETAFQDVTMQPTSRFEDEFWKRQRVWTTWLPVVFSQETLWSAITLLAILAIWKRRRRNAELRKRWEEEEKN
jgi:hypothetical protein